MIQNGFFLALKKTMEILHIGIVSIRVSARALLVLCDDMRSITIYDITAES